MEVAGVCCPFGVIRDISHKHAEAARCCALLRTRHQRPTQVAALFPVECAEPLKEGGGVMRRN